VKPVSDSKVPSSLHQMMHSQSDGKFLGCMWMSPTYIDTGNSLNK